MPRNLTKSLTGILIGLLIGSFTGCSSLTAWHHDLALRELGHRAFKCETCVPFATKYARHFERGWKQAYYNVSKGGDCCPPSTPPEQYWSPKYQTPDGCRKIAAWYEGYRQGVAAAQRDCRHRFSKVPVVATCEREDNQKCNPVQPLRSGHVDGPVELGATNEFHDGNNAVTESTGSEEQQLPEAMIDTFLDEQSVENNSKSSVELSSFESPLIVRLPPVAEE